MVTLPQFREAKVNFAVKTREGKTRVISCKTSNVAVPMVFGSVNADSGSTSGSKLEDFPHQVVHDVDENTSPAGAPTVPPRVNPNQPHWRDDNVPDGPWGRHQSRLHGTGEIKVYEYTSVDTGGAPASDDASRSGLNTGGSSSQSGSGRRLPPNVTDDTRAATASRTFCLKGDELFADRWDTYMRRRYRSSNIMAVTWIIFSVMIILPGFFSTIFVWFFTYNLFATYPVPMFWATLVVWVTILLCDVAAQRSRGCSLGTLARLACRALLYGVIFGLINLSTYAAATIVTSLYWLIIVPGTFVYATRCVRKMCFGEISLTLLLMVDPVDVAIKYM